MKNTNYAVKPNKSQKVLQWLMSQDGITLRKLYFRMKLYQGGSDITFNNMMGFLGIQSLSKNGENIFRTGDSYPQIDEILSALFTNYMDSLLTVSQNERQYLEKYQGGKNPTIKFLPVSRS